MSDTIEITYLTTHFGTPPIRLIPRCEAPEYLRFVRTLPCIVSGCKNPAEAHHAIYRSKGNNASDFSAIPACQSHHTGPNGIHRLGLEVFEKEYGVSVGLTIIRCFEQWHEAGYTL